MATLSGLFVQVGARAAGRRWGSVAALAAIGLDSQLVGAGSLPLDLSRQPGSAGVP
jgi:hypothetical protein